MKVEKVINNNLIRTTINHKEALAMGKGLGFKQNVGDLVDESRIERVYLINQKEKRSRLEELLDRIPYNDVKVVNEIVDYASQALQTPLDESIWLGLIDHVHYAIERVKKGVIVKNALLWEISRFYNREFLISKEALKIVEKHQGVVLPEDEAGFIALYLVNAQMEDSTRIQTTMQMTTILRTILDIVKYHFGLTLNESSLHYDRFVTHLKYFIQRLHQRKFIQDDDLGFIDVIKQKYTNEYACALKIERYIEGEFKTKLTENEIVYLTIHMRRVIDESR